MVNFEKNIAQIPYTANSGFGLIFKSKSFIINEENVYIISPGPFNEQVINSIKELEKQIIVIAPNNCHHFHLPLMKKEFPNAKFYGPKRAIDQSKVRLDPLSKLLDQNSELKGQFVKGNKALSETVFYHENSKTLFITDLCFNMHHEMNFLTGFWLKLAGVYKKLGMSKLVKVTIKDKKEFKESLESLLSFPFERVLLNHGDEITREQFTNQIIKGI